MTSGLIWEGGLSCHQYHEWSPSIGESVQASWVIQRRNVTRCNDLPAYMATGSCKQSVTHNNDWFSTLGKVTNPGNDDRELQFHLKTYLGHKFYPLHARITQLGFSKRFNLTRHGNDLILLSGLLTSHETKVLLQNIFWVLGEDA